MKVLFVAGDYDDACGRASGYMAKLGHELRSIYGQRDYCFTYAYNGGWWEKLQNEIVAEIKDSNIIYWFSHSPANKPRFVERVKTLAPHAILIMLSRNDNHETSIFGQAAKMLSIKANLMLELNKAENGMFRSSVLDPLGNCFLENEPEIQTVARVLVRRADQLSRIERVPSISIGKKILVPLEEEFFSIARESACRFNEILHADKQDRYLGNLSFRCENGFPSFRDDHLIYVSKRNLDKRFVDNFSFVAIHPYSFGVVQYYGDEKPSVDTPIQLRLYDYYRNIRYMIHSHVYIEDALDTDRILPCGAVEEADEIFRVLPNKEVDHIAINLLGHGSLVGARDVNFLKTIKYVSRPLPAVFHNFLNMYNV